MVQEKREPIKFFFEKMKETGTAEVTGKEFQVRIHNKWIN